MAATTRIAIVMSAASAPRHRVRLAGDGATAEAEGKPDRLHWVGREESANRNAASRSSTRAAGTLSTKQARRAWTALRVEDRRRRQERAAAGVGVAFQALEFGAHFGGVLEAQVAVFFQGAIDDVFQPGGKIRIDADGRGRSAIEDGFEDQTGGVAAEGEAYPWPFRRGSIPRARSH